MTDLTGTEPAPPRPRRRGSWLRGTLGCCVVVVAVVLLWPQRFGGQTAFVVVSGHSMEPTYHTGDLALVRRGPVGPGDVIAYRVPEGEPGAGHHVIHRVVRGDDADGFVTQGDNRGRVDPWRPRGGEVLGRVAWVVPQGGTWLFRLLSPLGLALFTGGAVMWMAWPSPRRTASEPCR